MKVRILNSGGYVGFKNAVFPFEVYGHMHPSGRCVVVLGSELKPYIHRGFDPKWPYAFFIGDGVEIIDED